MSDMKIYDLTVNYLVSPCGIDSNPRFSYKASSGIRGDSQKTRRICVYSDSAKTECVWDSGKENTESMLFVQYGGEPLLPVKKYYYTVSAESEKGACGTADGTFVTGKLDERWDGKWISGRPRSRTPEPDRLGLGAQYLRKSFKTEKKPVEAYLTICGLGYFESCINGKKTGDDVLSPAFTRYDYNVLYMQYDVSSLIREGENVLSVTLGNGWYNCFAEDPWNTKAASWRSTPKLICELKMIYSDGTVEKTVSDTKWKFATYGGPIVFNGIRNGEHYNANYELGEWQNPGYDETEWSDATITRAPGGTLSASELEPIKVYKTFYPKKKWQTPDGAWVFDFGQNMAGFGNFRFKGKAGSEITIRYSDVLKEDGNVDNSSIGGFVRSHGFQTDKYIKKSDEIEIWQPKFVYHGFQYLVMEGIDYEPEFADVMAFAVCSAVGNIGRFSCSDELLNKLQHLCRWSSISNMESIPTDCPHREKNGWTGDASISSEQMLTNFGSRAFFTKWSADMRISQRPAGQIPSVVPSTGWGYNGLNGPDWSSALIMVPYYIWLYNDDEKILRDNYDAIKRNCDFMESMTDDYTVEYGTGDWCAPFEGPAISKNMGAYKCPLAVSDTAFFYNAAKTVVRIAKILGKDDDAAYYTELAAKIKAAFREKFFDKETFTVSGDCQTATAAMIYFGLNEEDEYEPLLEKLISQIEKTDWHLDFGILGCKFVMHTLGAAGKGDIGQRMIAQRTFPGCQEWINRGATTLWECWNGGGSHNHHMFSDLSSFLYKYVGGISPDTSAPGFRHVILRPAIECGMESASAEHESMHGNVKCYWANRDGKITLGITVPFGCTGTLYMPAKYSGKLVCDGKKAEDLFAYGEEKDFLTLDIPSGEYILTADRIG